MPRLQNLRERDDSDTGAGLAVAGAILATLAAVAGCVAGWEGRGRYEAGRGETRAEELAECNDRCEAWRDRCAEEAR